MDDVPGMSVTMGKWQSTSTEKSLMALFYDSSTSLFLFLSLVILRPLFPFRQLSRRFFIPLKRSGQTVIFTVQLPTYTVYVLNLLNMLFRESIFQRGCIQKG